LEKIPSRRAGAVEPDGVSERCEFLITVGML
jgi:hypothetical protein